MLNPGYQDFLMALGQRIQVLRKDKGLSQERLAERLGMDRVSIGYVEQGRRSPRLSTLYAIADALDVRVIDLFRGLEPELVPDRLRDRDARPEQEGPSLA